jgi:hypothetical protein
MVRHRDRPNRALPGRAITYDRVENGQQLASDRDEGDLLRFSHCYEALDGFKKAPVGAGLVSFNPGEDYTNFGLRVSAEQCRHWQVMAEIELERRKSEGREV